MARLKNDKIAMGANFAQKLEGVQASIISEYAGITAEDLRQLRRELKAVDGELLVVKNRVAKKVLADVDSSIKDSVELLKGPVVFTLIRGDAASATKAVFNFSGDHDAFKITGGVLDEQKLGVAELKAISELPPKEVLLAKIIGSLVSPHRGLIGVVNGVNSKLVRLLAAIRDQKQ